MNPITSSFRKLAFLTAAAGSALSVSATTLVYSDFSNLTGMQLNGSAATINASPVVTGDGTVLRLTNDLWQGGSAFSKTTVPLQGQNSFSTFFSFRITDPIGIIDGDGRGADGITFTVQTQANNVGGVGAGIGYENINPSVGIEFDTWDNGWIDGYNGNHVGINLNGSIASVARTNIATRMNDGNAWHSWIDYNGATDLLEVRLSQVNLRPTLATLSYTVDLQTVLGSPNAYVGFTSGTGAAGGDHDIINWEFRDTYNPVNAPDTAGTLGLLGLALIGLVAGRRALSNRA